jgi:hypothetical protein
MRIHHTTAGPKDSTKQTAIMKDAAVGDSCIALLDPVGIRLVPPQSARGHLFQEASGMGHRRDGPSRRSVSNTDQFPFTTKRKEARMR